MNIIHIIVLFPLISCVALLFFKKIFSDSQVIKFSVGSILVSMFFSIYFIKNFSYQNDNIFVETLWTFIAVDNFQINFGFLIDGLSLTMLIMVTCIGFLVHLFSSWYMGFKTQLSSFFAYMNLFIFSMIVLVLSDNLIFMFLGWEGVGICSYLLVGYYYKNINSGYAALKGFFITRIGDVFLLLSIFLIYKEFGTTNFEELKLIFKMIKIKEHIFSLHLITIFLLLGAIGKSAQIPLQTWLADAMMGPTPVSALIHAATMVTAGIYLISRTYFLFSLIPVVLYILGIIGSITLIVSCCSALVQTDVKRILAYSTMSQISYMFIALSMQNWTAAIQHLVAHAIFKALIFLAAGSIIILLKNEKNIFKMGGLKRHIPLLYISFLVGGSSLASFPFITSGFYSKRNILFFAFENNFMLFFISGLIGLFLTTLYTYRMIFVIFFGTTKRKLLSPTEFTHSFPLIVLIIFSTFIELYINFPLFQTFSIEKKVIHFNFYLEIICSFISLFGISLSYYLWVVNKKIINNLLCTKVGIFFNQFFFNACGFDYIYNVLFVNPYLYITKFLMFDPLGNFFNHFKNLFYFIYRNFVFIHNGYLRAYLLWILLGCIACLETIILYV
ncbi:MAG: NADH-quinone oxidoreductase subunit L [Buchnera aphidicola (Nurudea yanoniella)]